MTRVAIYARYSSENQNERSLVDQIRECRELADRNGWDVVQVYQDAAMSGSSDRRPGFQTLIGDASKKQFDLVVVEALDRLSRKLADTAKYYDELDYHGVGIFTKDHGAIGKMHVALMGMFAEQFISDLRHKTRRGQKGRIKEGRSAGGIAFGYSILPKGDRALVPEEAEVVRDIFTLYANGASPREIASTLNKQAVLGPNGKPWKDTTIRGQPDRGTGILNNELYIGRLVYGRTEYKKNPVTGKRVARPKNESEWTISDRPDLRIVSDELWGAVRDRQYSVRLEMPRDEDGNPLNRVHRKSHVLSGIIHCGVCNGPMAITAKGRYGCTAYRSNRSCTNSKTVPRSDVEERVLGGLKTRLFDTSMVSVFMDEFRKQVIIARARQQTEGQRKLKRFKELGTLIERLVDSIADGTSSTAVIKRLEMLEAEKAVLENEREQQPDNGVLVSLPNMGDIYRKRLNRLVNGLEDAALKQESIEIIQSMIDKVTVTPSADGFDIDVEGEIGAILNIVDAKYEQPAGLAAGRSLSVVAGARLRHCFARVSEFRIER